MSNPIQAVLEQRLSVSLESFLRRRYNDEGKGCVSIAKELGINKTIVLNYMKKFGIKRTKKEHNNRIQIQRELEKKYGNLKECVTKRIKNGQLIKDLAKELEVNPYTLSLWCKEWNICTDREGRPIEFYRLQKRFGGKLKEFLEEEYLKKKRTIRDIGTELRLKGDLLKRFLQYFEISIRGRAEANIIRDNVPEISELTYNEEQIIYGSLMGDGTVSCHIKDDKIEGNVWFSERHSIEQKEYLEWKSTQLKRLNVQFYIKENEYVNLKTSHLKILTELRQKFYTPIKRVTKDILNRIHTLGLAVWYQDDGCYNKTNRNAIICTHNFSYNEHLLMQEYFKERWNLDVRIHRRESKESGKFKSNYKEYYYLYVPVKDTPRFFEIIKPYIHETMLYKIGIDTKV